MACCNRRGCADRFRGRVNAAELLVILRFHGSCAGCSLDVTDNPRFRDGTAYCPACHEERWPSGDPGPFERGKAQVYR